MRCPTCSGSGEVIGSGDFAPGLSEALHAIKTGAGLGYRARESVCAMCVVIDYATPGVSRDALIASAAGRLSGRALHASLRQLDIRVGLESIFKHRNEGHAPS